MLTIQRFDPTPCGFPPPQVAVLPQPEMAGFRARRNGGDERLRWYARARYALTDAYRLCGLDKGGELIAPSYHCRTMIDPALAIGSHVQLYPLKEDLAPDLATLLPMLADRADRPRALLVSHFFGVAQPLDSIAAACREQRVSLIEDCSHALPRRMAADSPSAVGEVGDFAVASPYKFFACPDGGLLWSNRPALPPVALRPAPWRSEVQAAVDSVRAMVGRSLDSRGTPPQPVLPSASAAGRVWEESSDEPSEHYDRRDESGAPLRVSRCIVAHTDVARLVSRRRANYQAWAERVRGLRHCRALFPTLGSDCAPYMFALLLERPESDFAKLKRLGVPIWRWDEMARSQCAVARHYRMALIHLPCHQSLSRSELDWMIGAVERVCASSPERSAA